MRHTNPFAAGVSAFMFTKEELVEAARKMTSRFVPLCLDRLEEAKGARTVEEGADMLLSEHWERQALRKKD